MDLKSKTDKQIKRFLKSISDTVKVSKIYNSIHYISGDRHFPIFQIIFQVEVVLILV